CVCGPGDAWSSVDLYNVHCIQPVQESKQMTAEHFRLMREANPFVPFTIHLADGRTFPVPHRDFVSQSPSGRTIIVCRPDDTCSVVDLYLVTELEVQVPSASENGVPPD